MADWVNRFCFKISDHFLLRFQRLSIGMRVPMSCHLLRCSSVTWVVILSTVVALLMAVLPCVWIDILARTARVHEEPVGDGSVSQQRTRLAAKQSQFCGLFAGSQLTEGFDAKPVPALFSEFKQTSETSLFPVYSRSKSKDKTSAELTGEALSSLHLAREMTNQGKTEKATKIFVHALALDPKHPDILNEYGEFLEKTKKDIVLAEHMYCKALIVSPTHTRALSNRQRTLPLVEEIDQNLYNRIEKKRDVLIRVPEGHPGLRRMIQENYYNHLYHTTAMEGNTFTLSQTRSFVETRIVISGKSIIEHNEILGMEAALSFLNSSVIKRIGAITIKDIKDIHRRVLGFVDPIGAGIFRTTQVFVGDFIPPEADLVEKLMKEFIDWLNSDDALSLHPIEMAALAHYKFVYIHPFYDGNGRTSRLLMNLVLMQAGYPPIILPVEEKQHYYEHLEAANNGDIRPFIRFIAYCTEKTLDEYLWASVENVNRTFPEISIKRSDDKDNGRTILTSQP